ncbi:hypothetical protein Btru_058841 [Bulinus truncatus]|nr:hypothetical protein Btru_058841 [Bulinus truncatus]
MKSCTCKIARRRLMNHSDIALAYLYHGHETINKRKFLGSKITDGASQAASDEAKRQKWQTCTWAILGTTRKGLISRVSDDKGRSACASTCERESSVNAVGSLGTRLSLQRKEPEMKVENEKRSSHILAKAIGIRISEFLVVASYAVYVAGKSASYGSPP